MTKITTTKTNSIILAFILIAGTIVSFSPPFMLGIEAQSEYGMDNIYKSEYPSNSYKKYKDNNAIVKKIDCVNSNTNINGLNGEDTDTLSEPVVTGSLATLPTEQDIGVDNNAFENSERNNRYNNNDFDCINNNNNAGGQGPPGPTGATGPPGINVIDSSNYYSVVGESGIISTTGEGASSFASCDDGDFAISGAYRIGTATATTGAGTYDVRFFGAIGILPSGTWQTFIVGLEGTQVRTTVNCFDNPPLRP